jgi:hypothetical protein
MREIVQTGSRPKISHLGLKRSMFESILEEVYLWRTTLRNPERRSKN